jgi:hypothetical protein
MLKRIPPAANLPAVIALTEREAAALALADQEIAKYRGSGSPWSSASLMSHDGSAAMVRDVLQLGVADVRARLLLLQLARAGDRNAADVLDQLMLEVQSAGRRMPTELEAYDMDRRTFGRAAQGPGPKRATRLSRDLCIMLTFCAVADQFPEIPRFKRPQGRKKSVSELVAMALQSAGVGMGHKAVEAVANRYRGAWPTQPGWST